MSKSKALFAGLLAGLIAALAMTVAMLLLASFGIATPLVIIGDRLSVFISPGPFLSLMGRVGGYNHLKQLGGGSTIGGQLLAGAFGGLLMAALYQRRRRSQTAHTVPIACTISIFVILPIIVLAILLWPVLGTSYLGFPIASARLITLIGFALDRKSTRL